MDDEMTLEDLAAAPPLPESMMHEEATHENVNPEVAALPVPAAPTQKQREQHALTHLPYASIPAQSASGQGSDASVPVRHGG